MLVIQAKQRLFMIRNSEFGGTSVAIRKFEAIRKLLAARIRSWLSITQSHYALTGIDEHLEKQ